MVSVKADVLLCGMIEVLRMRQGVVPLISCLTIGLKVGAVTFFLGVSAYSTNSAAVVNVGPADRPTEFVLTPILETYVVSTRIASRRGATQAAVNKREACRNFGDGLLAHCASREFNYPQKTEVHRR